MPKTPRAAVSGSGLPEDRIAALKEELERQNQIFSLAALLNALGNPTRLRILYLLWRNTEVRVNDLAAILDLTTPAISQQLKKLRTHALVQTRREAQTVYYRLNADSDLVRCITWFFERGTFPEHPGRVERGA